MKSSGPLSTSWTTYLCLLSILCSLFTPVVLPPYKILSAEGAAAASLKDGQFEATILKTVDEQGSTVNLPLTVSFLKSGTARVTVDEEKRKSQSIELRHDSKARKERYNEAEKWAIVGGLTPDADAKITHEDKAGVTVQYGPEGAFEAVIKFEPFAIDFKRDGTTQVQFNDRGLMNMEHWRAKVDKPEPEKKEGEEGQEGEEKKAEEEPKKEEVPAHLDESTWWDETFGGNTDTKPRGPESVALDITFPGYEHVYGIPEHAGPLSLKETRGGEDNYEEPYRLYNADVFEYVLDSPMTLYGAIPFMQAQRKDSTVGVFWLNGAETWIDVTKAKGSKNPLNRNSKASTNTHWISESGIMDVFVFLGPTPKDISKNYAELTGTTALPAEFSLGYHQCRWNYVSDDDVKEVDRKMDKFNIPYDVIWLDIEYTHEKKYFTWDPDMFKDPISMGQQLDDHGRKLVTIIDPHIKNVDNYPVISDMKSKGLAVKNKDANDFDGWCWPGSSMWIDAFNPAAIKWWTSLFKYDYFKGTMENTYIWNDMNEPSVFNGPEVTMPKDNLHHGNWEHRDVHNINGMTFHNATWEALVSRKKGEMRRPFVLTRSFFAGSQRLGAMWTGDNQASWDHLGAAVPMILAQGIAGFPFSGADVGGFFGNPEIELQTRWYQAGAFYPFFRGHAHIDARRREPYMAAEPHRSIITAALRLRYSLMPSWYTAFFHANQDGSPIIRPMYWTHPSEESGFAVDDQFFVGSTGLLVKPIVEKDKFDTEVYIPDDENYYDYFTYNKVSAQKGKSVSVSAPIETIPFDDYTLVVVIGKDGSAKGELYVDDGDSFEFEKGQFLHRAFEFKQLLLTSEAASSKPSAEEGQAEGEWMKQFRDVSFDKVVLVGAPSSWEGKKEVPVTSGGETHKVRLDFYKAEGGRAAFAVLGRLGVRVGADWEVDFA
ncbi:glucosidase ii alpha subunit [Apiospora aurea]|uniref:alpha-glucosidase n=1 Tax=Apiospora aurea TaxID=335848 RepID=A0ABR1QLU2_9PEZI